MIVTEFTVDHPILRETLTRTPDAEVVWERSDVVEGGVRTLVWTECDDHDAFENAIDSDPTVELVERVTESGRRHLYSLELTDEGRQASIYPVMVEESGVIESLVGTREGWTFRVIFPDRGSVDEFVSYCRDRDLRIRVHRLFAREGSDVGVNYGLTDRQRVTLRTALKEGYLEIPRHITLSDLADKLDISPNAASERFRRATRTLVENTVARGET